jgi:uncharacterized protein
VPGLKIVSAENDVAWMAYLMWRMDRAYERGGALTETRLELRPSDYVKRQIYATFINEPVFVDGLHRYGPDNIMWSSDYPHTAATWPRSLEFMNQTFGGLSENSQRKIVHDTAARIYGLEV